MYGRADGMPSFQLTVAVRAKSACNWNIYTFDIWSQPGQLTGGPNYLHALSTLLECLSSRSVFFALLSLATQSDLMPTYP